MPEPFEGAKLPSEVEQVSPHSHLPIRILKKIGHVVKVVGKDAAEMAITAAVDKLAQVSEE